MQYQCEGGWKSSYQIWLVVTKLGQNYISDTIMADNRKYV